MAYTSTASPAELAATLRAAASVVLLSHSKPDGDALGSLLAVRHALVSAGKRAEIVLMGPVETTLLAVAEEVPLRRFERDGLPAGEPDLIVVLDTGSWSQVEPVASWLRERRSRTIGVDHHAGGSEDLAPRRSVSTGYASTTAALVPVLGEFGASFDVPLCTALFMGLATDTGWFRFSSADADVFALAARLLEGGARRDWLYATLEQNSRPERLAMLSRALATLELLRGGEAALAWLGREDFAAVGCGPEEIGGFVNEALAIGSVRLSILLSQNEPGVTRASFRSKPLLPGEPPDRLVDVNALAGRFGGGGHVHAAGARLRLELGEALRVIRTEVGGTVRA